MENIVDARGQSCPGPVIMTKKALEGIKEGKIVVMVDNEVSKENVLKFAKSLNCEVAVENKGNEYHISIYKKNGSTNNNNDNYVVVISSDKFGEGDEKLGKLLMKSFVISMKEQDKKPDTMIFLNSGVRLTTEGSESIDDLKELRDMGVEILSCGTCLDFYGIKDKLLIGSITNMYTITEKMVNSKTIKL